MALWSPGQNTVPLPVFDSAWTHRSASYSETVCLEESQNPIIICLGCLGPRFSGLLLGPPSLTSPADCRKWRNAQRQNQQQQAAAAPVTATGALCSWKWSGWWGSGLAPDHSDTCHSRLKWTWDLLHAQTAQWAAGMAGLTHTRTFTLLRTYWPLQVLPSGCRVNPTGQLQRTPVAVSLHVLSQPPLLTAQVSVDGSTKMEKEKEGGVLTGDPCFWNIMKIKLQTLKVVWVETKLHVQEHTRI